MAQEVTRIKKRIASVSGAYKVTSAMKLVSTVKLGKWKTKMLNNREYTARIKSITDDALKNIGEISSPYFSDNINAKKNLYIVVSSTLGLCGSYNNNVFRVADNVISENDDVIILGNKGYVHYADGAFQILEGYKDYTSIDNKKIITLLTEYVINEYVKGTYKSVHMVYSSYKNSLVFIPKDYQILPLINKNKEENAGYAPIMEPNKDELVNSIIPLYIKNVIYSLLLESEVSEHAARCNAMDNATNNAKDLLDNLKIQFNKARQNTITQEITEIVGASKAL